MTRLLYVLGFAVVLVERYTSGKYNERFRHYFTAIAVVMAPLAIPVVTTGNVVKHVAPPSSSYCSDLLLYR